VRTRSEKTACARREPPPCALARGGTGRELELRRHERAPSEAVDEHGICRLAGLRIDDFDACPFGREVPVAERQHGDEDGSEVAAALGQAVFVARRALAVALALEEPRLDERIKAPRQHVGRDAEAFAELLEARHARESVTQDKDAPPLADALEAARDWAGHGAEALALHRSVLPRAAIRHLLSLCK
jgi:hypothetical protein